MIQKELLKLPVEDLVPYENNPRVISPEAVNACAESMRQCSALDPIEVDENNVILSGHTRRLALMQLHVDMADVVRYTGLTEEQKQKYRILANKTGEMSGWDFGKLEQELAEVDFGDFDFDFDLPENKSRSTAFLPTRPVKCPGGISENSNKNWQKLTLGTLTLILTFLMVTAKKRRLLRMKHQKLTKPCRQRRSWEISGSAAGIALCAGTALMQKTSKPL